MFLLTLVRVLLPIAFLTLDVWAIRVYPARMKHGDTALLKVFGFLIFRFRAETYWVFTVLPWAQHVHLRHPSFPRRCRADHAHAGDTHRILEPDSDVEALARVASKHARLWYHHCSLRHFRLWMPLCGGLLATLSIPRITQRLASIKLSLPRFSRGWCTEQMPTVPGADGCDQLGDDGGDATLLMHEGTELEALCAKDGTLPDPESATNLELKCALQLIKDFIPIDATKWTRTAKYCKSVSEETTTGVPGLKEMAAKDKLLFSTINVNDCETKAKIDNVYDCRHSLIDGIMRTTDVTNGGKRAPVCGFGDVGKGCAFAPGGCGARVFIPECGLLCGLQACMEGFKMAAIGSVVSEFDIFVSSTGSFNIITREHLKKVKNNSFGGNIRHYGNEIDIAGLKGLEGMKVCNIIPQVIVPCSPMVVM